MGAGPVQGYTVVPSNHVLTVEAGRSEGNEYLFLCIPVLSPPFTLLPPFCSLVLLSPSLLPPLSLSPLISLSHSLFPPSFFLLSFPSSLPLPEPTRR